MKRSAALRLLNKFRQRILRSVYGREGIPEACAAVMPNFDYADWDCFPVSEFLDSCPVEQNEAPSAPTVGAVQGLLF